MGSLSLSPSRLWLLPLLTLLLLLLLPPPARGGETPPENPQRSPQLEAILRHLGLSSPPVVQRPPLDVFQAQKLQHRNKESAVQLRAKRNHQPATTLVQNSIPPTRQVLIPLTKELFLEPSDGLFYLNLSREALLEKTPTERRVNHALLIVLNDQPQAKSLRQDLTGAVLPWLESNGPPKLLVRLSSCTSKHLSKEPQPLRAYLQMTYLDMPLRDRRRVRQLGPIRVRE
ncbi:uncharacterized protein LOC141497603 [Macrotis lagotis]|uniref:uncharacterized protein LOC141497603 n=1 Tax=Macrotis lagotis TaxID=92651 RepID=UPI003D694899